MGQTVEFINKCTAGLFFVLLTFGCTDYEEVGLLTTAFERSDGKETATYEEGIQWWKSLEEASPYVCVQTFGETDAGLPMHLIVINADRGFSVEKIKKSGKRVWLINNGIHPGEPDGIDASMLFARDILAREDFKETFDSTVILIIPFYNVGGALNRNCCSRANQNGPEFYGFRGNARNLDLNRDFIKCDSRNAESFNKLFTLWDPDVYLETHVSNGADYTYTMTYLSAHPDKLDGNLRSVLNDVISPELFQQMAAQNDEMIPYVNVFNAPPDSGYDAFYDTPRYSTGYATLHNSIALLTETHMLKPFDQRVESTRKFLHALAGTINTHGNQISNARQQAQLDDQARTEFNIDWRVDSTRVAKLKFKGYRAYYDTSTVTNANQLYYDRTMPWEKEINYYNRLTPTKTTKAPKYYLVPAAWHEVVERLKWNGVHMTLLERDSSIYMDYYEVANYMTLDQPFEGHYLHHQTEVVSHPSHRDFLSGSYYLINTAQKKKRFIIETLEPDGPDSYFNWNFYDEILQQKEWFSSYVFDEEAKQMLEDPKILAEFEHLKATDSVFAASPMHQLVYLYKLSAHYERDHHLVYPVFRIE